MSVPEYVFLHRIQEFYDQLRSGRHLWKVDETMSFVDEKGREMIKRWIQDERFPWTFGRGYTILVQPAPVISLVVDSDSDRAGGYYLGNYDDEGIDYDPDGITPQMAWEKRSKLKTGTFQFVMTAPNSDMLTAIYCLMERALYEGENAPRGEEDIIQFSDYGISELRYSGSDVRPDQSFIPTAAFARTLRVTCTYLHTWSGRTFGKNGYAFSINIGNIAEDGELIQQNPSFIDGYPVLPSSESLTYQNAPGVELTGTSTGVVPVVLTSTGSFPAADNILIVPPNTALVFNAVIGANIAGISSAIWRFGGVIRRQSLASSTFLVGLTSYDVVADAIFSTAYIDIEADTTMGALRIAATGVTGYDITWTANVQVKELP